MGSLFGSLIATSNSLRAYDNSLSVIQNNVANVQTPGFARQRLTLTPKSFDVNRGLAGGVESGLLISSRDEYSEQSVRKQAQSFGDVSQRAAILQQIEPSFQITQGAGVPGALDQFFSSVSSWSVNPNDPVARQVVLDRASSVAQAFNTNAKALGDAANAAGQQIRTTVDSINNLASQLHDLAVQRSGNISQGSDPSLDAQIHSTLDQLSQLADFNVIQEPDGGIQLLFGGQTPLVIGNQLHKLQADLSNGPPVIRDDQGNDITSQLSGGSLHSLIDISTKLIPSYSADLDKLAQSFADNVNQVLGSGIDAGGSTPTQDLYAYDDVHGIAATLATNPLDPSQLAGAESGSPGGNGNVLKLAALSTTTPGANVSFSESYGQLASRVGRDLQDANNGADLQQQLLTQAQSLREQSSGVNLDEEAARMVEAQRAYQANAQLFTVLNSLTDSLINLIQQ